MAPAKKTAKARTNDLKVTKLTALLDDFDDEVKTIAMHLEEKRIHLLNTLNKSYDVAVINLPKAVRKMNWLENCKSDNILLSLVDDTKGEKEAAKVGCILSVEHYNRPKSVKRTPKKRVVSKSSTEEENTPNQTPGKKVVTVNEHSTENYEEAPYLIKKRLMGVVSLILSIQVLASQIDSGDL